MEHPAERFFAGILGFGATLLIVLLGGTWALHLVA